MKISNKLDRRIIYYVSTFSLFLILCLTFFYIESKEHIFTRQVEILKHQASEQHQQAEHFFLNSYTEALGKNWLISNSDDLIGYARNPSSDSLIRLTINWSRTIQEQNLFSQIRFLDTQGQEKIRINYYSQNPEIVTEENLQNKSHRDYFSYAKTLGKGEVGVFGIDLEVEHGQFVKPFMPTVRLITPIEYKKERYGYVITNYNLPLMLDQLAYRANSYLTPEILSDDSAFILAHDENRQFGNQIKERARFQLKEAAPELWGKITNNKSGYFEDDNHLFAFNKIYLNLKGQERFVVALTSVSFNTVEKLTKPVLDKLKSQLAISALLLTVIFSLLITRTARKKYYLESELSIAALKSMSPLIITNRYFEILKVNDEFLRWSNYPESSLIGKSVSYLRPAVKGESLFFEMTCALESVGYWNKEAQVINADEETFHILIRAYQIESEIARYIFTITDITERVTLELQLKEQSERDALTGCYNRRIFETRLSQHVALAKRYGDEQLNCLALIDLDHFKRVNDTFGHNMGDKVLKQTSAIMRNICRETDLVARVGGEEFAIILQQTKINDALMVVERIREAIEQCNELGVTMSAGIVPFSSVLNEEQIYQKADQALYQAKHSGRNRVIEAAL